MKNKFKQLFELQEKLYREHCSQLVDYTSATSGGVSKEYPYGLDLCNKHVRIMWENIKEMKMEKHFTEVRWV